MNVGSHVGMINPVKEAQDRSADLMQFFLIDPQSWHKSLPVRDDAAALRDSGIGVYIHAPYTINVATLNNRIRIPSRQMLDQQAKAAAAVGAKGLVVHGGHLGKNDDPEKGFDNWRKTFERAEFPLPILIENTAGGDNAMGRRLDRLARLWDVIGQYDPGFCLDTCHFHAGGEDLSDIVDRVKAITGRIDLVHANDSRDSFGSGADRHANLGTGQIDPDVIVAVVASAGADVIVETPGGAQGQAGDIGYLRSHLPT